MHYAIFVVFLFNYSTAKWRTCVRITCSVCWQSCQKRTVVCKPSWHVSYVTSHIVLFSIMTNFTFHKNVQTMLVDNPWIMFYRLHSDWAVFVYLTTNDFKLVFASLSGHGASLRLEVTHVQLLWPLSIRSLSFRGHHCCTVFETTSDQSVVEM